MPAAADREIPGGVAGLRFGSTTPRPATFINHRAEGVPMILEAIILDIRAGQEDAFEADFARASSLIQAVPGYLSHELLRCVEKASRYIFLARWETLEAHTVGFRQSAGYPEWKRLLHHYYDPMPVVQHFAPVPPARGAGL